MLTCPALIMAGGKSERMRAGGCGTHKALRTVAGSTLLEQNLRALFRFQFKEITVAVNATEDELQHWLAAKGNEIAARANARLHILLEDRPLGTIGAARSFASSTENLIVVNVDNLTELDLGDLLEDHLRCKAALTVATHRQEFPIPFGQIDSVGSRVVACREKQSIQATISSGAYVLNRRAMLHIPEGRTQAPDLINTLVQAGELVHSYHHTSWWIDVNDEAALQRAEADLCAQSFSPLARYA